MTRDEQIQCAEAQIELSRLIGLDFIVVIYDGIPLAALREIANYLCLAERQEVSDEEMLLLSRMHREVSGERVPRMGH